MKSSPTSIISKDPRYFSERKGEVSNTFSEWRGSRGVIQKFFICDFFLYSFKSIYRRLWRLIMEKLNVILLEKIEEFYIYNQNSLIQTRRYFVVGNAPSESTITRLVVHFREYGAVADLIIPKDHVLPRPKRPSNLFKTPLGTILESSSRRRSSELRINRKSR